MINETVLGCRLSKSPSFSQDEKLYIAASDTAGKMEEDYAPFVDKVLNRISFVPSRILDLGCGPGYIARRMSEVLPGANIYGVDKSSVMIEHAATVARNIIKERQLAGYPGEIERPGEEYGEATDMIRKELYFYGGRLRYILADSAALPFEDGIFDLIILKGTFKCLEEKLESLEEMYRVLGCGGEILIYEFRKDIPENEFNALTLNMKPKKAESLRRKLNCSLDINEYEKYLLEAGLSRNSTISSDGLDLAIRINKN